MHNTIISHAIDKIKFLEEGIKYDCLHFYIFGDNNTVNTAYEAYCFLNDVGVHKAIDTIFDHEFLIYGKLLTDIHCSISVANRYAYIKAFEIFDEMISDRIVTNEHLDYTDYDTIIDYLLTYFLKTNNNEDN